MVRTRGDLEIIPQKVIELQPELERQYEAAPSVGAGRYLSMTFKA